MKQNLFVTQDGCPTFYSWLMCRYLGRDNPFGDVAHDTFFDGYWPLDNKYTSIRDHLWPSDDRLMELFNQLWAEYKHTLRVIRALRERRH